MLQAKQRQRMDSETRLRVAAGSYARGLLNRVVFAVTQRLEQGGHFRDPIEDEIDTFLPWLNAKALEHVRRRIVFARITQAIITTAVKQLSKQRTAEGVKHKARVQHEREQQRLQKEETFDTEIEGNATSLLQQWRTDDQLAAQIDALREALLSKTSEAKDSDVVLALLKEGTVSKEFVLESLNGY